jgi:hypothetical protein
MKKVFGFKKWSVSLLIFVLLVAGGSMAGAEIIKIEGNPLEIRAENEGTMGAFRWEGGSLVNQYYGGYSWASVLILNGDSAPARFSSSRLAESGIAQFTPISHAQDGTWSIRTVYGAGDSGVEITQMITYTNGSAYYRKSWEIQNKGAETYTDLRFLHGGDATFGGYDSSLGQWDPSLRMVYLTNPDMGLAGIMGFYGAAASPADHYYEGAYSTFYSYMQDGRLPDTVNNSSYHDSGYALEWDRATLAPGESWTIVSYEKWTEAGFVQVFAPSDGEGGPGETVSYSFTISNEQPAETLFNFTALSSSGWTATLPVASQSIAAGETATVTVELAVGLDAVVGATDILTLIATAADDESITNADSVTTTVVPAKTGSLTVTITPPEAAAAGAQWRRAGTETWFDSGAEESGILPGTYSLEFKKIAGYDAPTGAEVTISPEQSATAAAVYLEAAVEKEPEEEPEESAPELPDTGHGLGLLPWIISLFSGLLLLNRGRKKS